MVKRLVPTDTVLRTKVLEKPRNYRVHRSHFAASDLETRNGKLTIRQDALPQHISLACPRVTSQSPLTSASPQPDAAPGSTTGTVLSRPQSRVGCPQSAAAAPATATGRRPLGDITNFQATTSPTNASPPVKLRKTLGLQLRRPMSLAAATPGSRRGTLRSPSPLRPRASNTTTAPASARESSSSPAVRGHQSSSENDDPAEVHLFLQQRIEDLEQQLQTAQQLKNNYSINLDIAKQRIVQLQTELTAAQGAEGRFRQHVSEVDARNQELLDLVESYTDKLSWKSITTPGSAWYQCVPEITGLPNVDSLEAMYEWLNWNGQAESLVYWNGRQTVNAMLKRRAGTGKKMAGRPSRRSFKSRDAFLLALAKLRTGLPDKILGAWSGIHRACVGRIFTTWVSFMDAFFNAEFPVPTTDQIKHRISSEWKHVYGTNLVRFVLDACELRIQQPASRKAARTCYSDYKSGHTAKILGAICPLGSYVGCSEAFPGRISDLEIFIASQFSRIIRLGDCIPTDKGFDQIQPSVAARGGRIVAPHRRGNGVKTYTSNEREENEGISNLRIHVERHFARVMNWGIFTRKKHKLVTVDILDKMFNVVSFMCNFQRPLYKETLDPEDSDDEGVQV